MRTKRYRIRDGVLRFEDGVTVFEDYLQVPDTVIAVDFNEVKHILKPLNLSNTKIDVVDFREVLTVRQVILPENVIILENLYWADEIKGKTYVGRSQRLKFLGIYDNRPLVYLSGTVTGHIPLRTEQRDTIYDAGYGVYSPGNHITFGDPVAEKYPLLVYELDMLALQKAEVIFFDLTNLSPGTCAELGYVVGQGWDRTKRVYYLYKDTPNFFINGLVTNMIRVTSIEEFIERDRYEAVKFR